MPSQSQHATLMHQADGTALLYTAYREDFVEELKARIPAPFRRWEKAEKRWVISAPAIEQAAAIARRLRRLAACTMVGDTSMPVS